MRDKFCLDSVLPFQSINNSSLNRSRSKETHSFSRAPRFSTINSNCPVNTYGSRPLSRKYSGIHIGSGEKSDFTKDLAQSPGSSRYNIKGQFQNNVDKMKGNKLTLSRQKIQFNSYIHPQKIKNPGVGHYHLQTQSMVRIQRAPKYSLRPKTKVINIKQSIYSQNSNPSPSDYNNNPQTSIRLGNPLKYIGCVSTRSKRFKDPNNSVPGPGEYQAKVSLSNAGKYVMSKHRGTISNKFDIQRRITKFDQTQKIASQRPGPGSYRISSEFGQYDGDVYEGLNKTKRSRYGK